MMETMVWTRVQGTDLRVMVAPFEASLLELCVFMCEHFFSSIVVLSCSGGCIDPKCAHSTP